MSKVRWVDLLNSESANTFETKESIPKKTNTQNEQGSVLHKNLLDSFNTADLDNSNVGINLQIKNMTILDKNTKTVNEENNLNYQQPKEEEQTKNVNEKEQEKAEVSVQEKFGKQINEPIGRNERKEDGTVLVKNKTQEENKIEERSQKENSLNKKEHTQEISKRQRKQCKIDEYVNKHERNEAKSRNSSLRRSSRNKKDNMKNNNETNKKNVEEKNTQTDAKKKENKVLKFNLENIKKTQKGKKRKERNNGTTDNSISKYDYTESCDITVDENNVPLNPTKKIKKKEKEKDQEEKEGKKFSNTNQTNLKNQINNSSSVVVENTQNKKSVNYPFMKNELNDKEKQKIQDFMNKLTMPNYKFIKEKKNSLTQDKEHNKKISDFNNTVITQNSENVSMSPFDKFNEHFDNYVGDIMNNYELSMNNVNSNRVSRRLKEIAVGKSTKEYKNYVKVVKYDERMEDDPKTPNAYENMTNATFQAKYNLWRKKLHKFDEIKEN